ncbi:hypothetical protein ABET51_15990 [Metabacillus fastidiosus]|uniref:hypothetical protein n=1 Tax=Metabacillus fastidiosus TaxID=1458 RepID=UPI003D2840DF
MNNKKEVTNIENLGQDSFLDGDDRFGGEYNREEETTCIGEGTCVRKLTSLYFPSEV